MENVFDVLKERGYLKQFSHEERIREILGKEKITFYIGFDPTADSFHVGNFIQLMVMSYMQKYGHRPIALIGGGTCMVGDPSGKTDMRKMLSKEQIDKNGEVFKTQISRFIDFTDGKAIFENNANWLLKLNYVDFLREIGALFSINNMLRAECYKLRFEKGLSFLELNYMIMQSYDFLQLFKNYNCTLQFGGDDQWSNILSGADLIRRKEAKEAFAATTVLLVNSQGEKMGKTVNGAVWIDKNKTSPYEFYQYFRNVDDEDVENCLALLTFLPMDEVRDLGKLKGSEINKAKAILAYEVTKIIHGEEEANKAKEAAVALFSKGSNMENVPTLEICDGDLGKTLIDILTSGAIIQSKSEGKRLISQGGVLLNDVKISDINTAIEKKDFLDDSALVRIGKKKFIRLSLKN
ncbi:MAG: tyrosine--tRNA ligase [Oscillospiraceae bacterium]|nr:tyrosine--tRNA ligase [Oscillospiraceae bacterium]